MQDTILYAWMLFKVCFFDDSLYNILHVITSEILRSFDLSMKLSVVVNFQDLDLNILAELQLSPNTTFLSRAVIVAVLVLSQSKSQSLSQSMSQSLFDREATQAVLKFCKLLCGFVKVTPERDLLKRIAETSLYEK